VLSGPVEVSLRTVIRSAWDTPAALCGAARGGFLLAGGPGGYLDRHPLRRECDCFPRVQDRPTHVGESGQVKVKLHLRQSAHSQRCAFGAVCVEVKRAARCRTARF